MKKPFYSLLAICMSINIGTKAQEVSYPKTEKVDVYDKYFGKEIADTYRWLENDTAKNTEAWVKAENKVTQRYLSQIPYRDKLKSRITELLDYAKYSAPQKDGDWFTFYKNDGLQNQALVYVQKGINGKPEVLLDSNKLSKGGTVALQSTEFSKKQKYFAYAVSASGSDWQEIYIMDFKSRKLIKEKLEYVKFTGMSWNGDDGFYYSGYSKPENEATKFSAKTEFQKVFYHKIGTPQSADKLIYEDKEHPLRYVSGGLT